MRRRAAGPAGGATDGPGGAPRPGAAAPLSVAVVGLGYVGTITAACLAALGHRVLAVDRDPARVAALAGGRAPVREPEVDARLGAALAAGRLAAAPALPPGLRAAGLWPAAGADAPPALDLVLLCVGTPALAGPGAAVDLPAGVDPAGAAPGPGALDTAALEAALRAAGRALRGRDGKLPPALVVVRSTVLPGTMAGLALPVLAGAAGGPPGRTWEAAYNPEFLREGTGVADLLAAPRIVVGERAPGAARGLRGLWAGLPGRLLAVPFAVAEAGKLADNAWHAVKVAFANELGRLGHGLGLDPQELAELFLADTRLNLGPAYLRPGGPYGGACLPKDLAALRGLARRLGQAVPLLDGAAASNRRHAAWTVERVRAAAPPPGPLLQLGLSFKPGSDDLRASPLLALARALRAAGYDLAVHDPDVPAARAAAALGDPALVAAGGAALDAALARAALVVVAKPVPGVSDRLPQGAAALDLHRPRRAGPGPRPGP